MIPAATRHALAVVALLLTGVDWAWGASGVNFGREVMPILADNCFACHGPDPKQRKAGLRLDLAENATRAAKSGAIAVVPGKPGRSQLLNRVTTTDNEALMPPAESHKPRLTAAQVNTLRRWIQDGAVWGKHWAFEIPTRPPVPKGARHPVDAFVHEKLVAEKLKPSPEAPRHTLIRRLSFDLTGLPPTAEELDAFLNDRSSRAYEKLVTRLLQSEHYGERMAMWWLDAARYADTDGYQSDDTRTNWPWRDWVIESFNRNQSFDQFTIEQFAGDLLPNATPDQTLATCFHRNHMTNGEGGRDPEESRVDYVIDRVNTMGTVWLGLTLGCAQCHSHKFDPITQVDYYSLSAFFNSVDEDGKAGREAKPYLDYQSRFASRAVAEAQELVDARKAREEETKRAAERPFAEWLAARLDEIDGVFHTWHPLHGRAESTEGTQFAIEAEGVVQTIGPNPNQDDYRLIGAAPASLKRITGLRIEVLPHSSHSGVGLSRGKSGEFILTNVKVHVRRRGDSQVRELAVSSAVADFSADKKANNNYGDVKDTLDDDPRNGWTTKGSPTNTGHVAIFALTAPYIPAPDEELIVEMRQRSTLGDANIGRFRISATDQAGEAVRSVKPAPLEDLAASIVRQSSQIEDKLRERLMAQFLEDYEPYRAPKESLERANQQLAEVKAAAEKLKVMVLAEREKPRDTFVLTRGVWDQHGEPVNRNAPTAIAPWPAGAAVSREGLARWLVSRENPLTARVFVNHIWQLFFGSGLVRTPEDFGLQGERPTHPELLDWLAVEFIENGWDVKRLISLIVTSETYRQNSAVNAGLLSRDPQNRLLARGARFRLPSWMLRDAALRDAGLLNGAIGGPPIRPYQPDGVWEENFMGRFHYQPTEGAAQYRRTLYAFWRRSIAPTFLFDTAQRRVCEVRTPRTNTPLQALTLLNDESFLEASRTIATQILQGPGRDLDRLRRLYRKILSRPPMSEELKILERELQHSLNYYDAHREEAVAFLHTEQSALNSDINPARIAAFTVVASLVLNLDEAITHE